MKLKLINLSKRIIPKNLHSILRSLYRRILCPNIFFGVEIETITACNRRCKYCPNSKFDRGLIKNRKYINVNLFHKIIDELAEIKFKGVLRPHFYGEPLLDKRLPYLLAYARKKLPNVYISVFSNGDLLTLDLYKKLIKSGVNKFNLTQHGNSTTQELKEILNYYKNNRDGSVDIQYSKFYQNKFVKFYNRGGLIQHKSIQKMKRCNFPSNTINIDYKGNVILCCNDYLSSIKFGNLKKKKLMDIWNKREYKKLRRELKKGIFKLEICRICSGNS